MLKTQEAYKNLYFQDEKKKCFPKSNSYLESQKVLRPNTVRKASVLVKLKFRLSHNFRMLSLKIPFWSLD